MGRGLRQYHFSWGEVTMPFLPIDDSIVSNPSRAHLAIVESWMLWPNDEAQRQDAYTSAVVAMGHDLRREGKLDHSTLEELFDLAVTAKPLAQLNELARTPLEQGLMAGNILIAAIEGKNENGGRIKRGEIDDKLRELFAPQAGKTNKSSFVNTIWQNYRSVSHLWAAHIQFTENQYGRLVFPCELKDIIEFLWLSEEWRKKGESTKTAPRAPSTILPPGECVRTPETMKFSK
jgi:hypothetical protein